MGGLRLDRERVLWSNSENLKPQRARRTAAESAENSCRECGEQLQSGAGTAAESEENSCKQCGERRQRAWRIRIHIVGVLERGSGWRLAKCSRLGGKVGRTVVREGRAGDGNAVAALFF